MPTTTELSGVVAEYIAAVKASDLDRIIATFAPDAYVNDNRREIWGTDAIRASWRASSLATMSRWRSARSWTTTEISSSAPASTVPTTRPICLKIRY